MASFFENIAKRHNDDVVNSKLIVLQNFFVKTSSHAKFGVSMSFGESVRGHVYPLSASKMRWLNE